MGQENGLHALGYNSAKSEPIWMKFGTLWAKCWGRGWPWQILGAIHTVATVWEGAEILCFYVDFPSDKFYDISTQQCQSVRQWKRLEQNFDNFTIRGRFSKKTQKLLKKFPGLATSGHHIPAIIMITNAKNSRLNGPPTGCLVSIFTVRINSKSLPWAVRCIQAANPPNVFAISITYLYYR